MKNLILLSFLVFPLLVFSQDQYDIKAYFVKTVATIKPSSKKQIEHEFQILIPAQPDKTSMYLEYELEKTIISPADSNIYLTNEKKIILTGKEEAETKKVNLIINRDSINDQIVLIKLKAFKDDGTELKLKDSATIKKILIKPYSSSLSESKKNDYKFWIFTGTNLDLLDGVKPKDLYLRGDYIFNVKNNQKKTRSWFNATLGSNRYVSSEDTFEDVNFTNIINEPFPQDSLNIVKGFYESATKTTVESIFASIYYLWHIREISTDDSKFFATFGSYLDRQTISTEYNNSVTLSDTVKIAISDIPESYQGMPKKLEYDQINFNLGFGFTHIITTDKVEIKSSLTGGCNFVSKPARIRTNQLQKIYDYKNDWKPFAQFRMDATVLDPGISLGFETFGRIDYNPLFNVFLTKVLDLQNISSLFSPVSSIE